MLFLGLLLLVAAGLLTGGLLRDNTIDSKAHIFGFTLPHLTVGQLFCVGVGTGFLATLGLAMLLGGLRRSGRRRREQRLETKSKRQREDQLKEENARLASQLEQQRQSAPTMTAPIATTETTTPIAAEPVTGRSSGNGPAAPTTGATAVD